MTGKKGAILVFEIGIWIMRIVMVIVIIMGVALMIRGYVNTKVDLYVAEPALIMQVVGSSPAFLYRDASGTLQRAVSAERFANSEQLLNVMFSYRQRNAAAKITLLDQAGKEISSVRLNPDYYNELSQQVQKLAGKNVVQQIREWPVLIIQKGKPVQGRMKVEVLQPA
jgi:hypothetical protein